MLPTGDSSQPQRQTLVEQNKGAKDDTSPKWPPEKSRCGNTQIKQISKYESNKIQRWTVYNDKGDNLSRRHPTQEHHNM